MIYNNKNIYPIDQVLLALLTSKNQYVSGEKIAQSLLISRAAIHKKVEKLRLDTYNIEAESNKGFILKYPLPYKLIPEKIFQNISIPNCPTILFMKNTTSTNTIAKQIIKEQKEPFILLTRDQVMGRGRMNRPWQMSADKDIAMSFTIPCNISHSLLFSIIRLVSVVVCQLLNKYSDNKCMIKWPNDIITKDNKKICGILTESVLEDNEIKYIIIGIGININSSDLPDYADSLKELTGKECDINQFCSELIESLIILWEDFPSNEETIVKKWEQLFIWKNEEVLLIHNDQEYRGILQSVLLDGSLILEINKEQKTFLSGDLSKIKLNKI
ncbi:MAG: biotin--[acetyl-CoA-carboxylase] ligase [Spirochaetota bacterium]|nr:biotin--[acetyl-CoA-carboxylase] ligase [Spirochaetota bacterium]